MSQGSLSLGTGSDDNDSDEVIMVGILTMFSSLLMTALRVYKQEVIQGIGDYSSHDLYEFSAVLVERFDLIFKGLN